jgi:hypothetical protein
MKYTCSVRGYLTSPFQSHTEQSVVDSTIYRDASIPERMAPAEADE